MSSNEWKEVTFEEIMSIPLRNGLSKPKAIRGLGVKMVNMGELFKYDRIFDKIEMDKVPVSESEFINSKLESGDLLFARQSLVWEGAGKCAVIMQAAEDLVYESHIIRVRLNKEEVDPLFYYYYFKSNLGRNRIMSIVEQVAAAGIRGSDLKKVKIPKLILEEQKSIAATLSCLDDKIELNNRMNKNLEEMAQAIFKSWFVDFEPFQDGEFEESELGMIPKGWRVGTLEEVCNIKYGKNLPTKKLQTQGYYVFGGNGIIGFYEEYLYSNPQVIISCRGAASGKVLTTLPYSFITNNSLVLELKQVLNYEFLKYYCLNNTFEKYATGSAQPQITIENIKFVKILIPPLSIMDDFKRRIEVLDGHKYRNYLQNNNLEMIRDTLLPKLMSGEIRVPIKEVE